jgi:hypothetical protein
MGKCKHDDVCVSYSRGRQDTFKWVDGRPSMEFEYVKECRICNDCGTWLSLGPSNDTPEVCVEIRAAQIVADRETNGVESPPITWCSIYEWFGFDDVNDRGMYEQDKAAWHAGYLARCIATHDDVEHRMFPLCTGTTQLAPTNRQCMRCERYGQSCDATHATAGEEGET